MSSAFQLTSRHMSVPDLDSEHVRGRADRLDELYERIVSCHVVLALAGHHHRHGDRYTCHVTLALPGHEIVVSHELSAEHDGESIVASVDRAFDEAERQLTDWSRREYGQGHMERHGSVEG